MSTTAELACIYSSLILADDDVAVTGEKVQTILKAANVDVDPYWPGLFAKALEGVNIKELITKVGSGIGSGPAVAGGAAPATAAGGDKKEEKKEEKKAESEPESDDDMGFGLFD